MKKRNSSATTSPDSPKNLIPKLSGFSLSQSDSQNKPISKQKKCTLCNRSQYILKTQCCKNWICDDYEDYKTFSLKKKSCLVNHYRFTICGYHYNNSHSGHWQVCDKCQKSLETEIYVWYGTNQFNFEKLKIIPAYTSKKCIKCQRIIHLAVEPYTVLEGKYTCFHCLALEEGFLN